MRALYIVRWCYKYTFNVYLVFLAENIPKKRYLWRICKICVLHLINPLTTKQWFYAIKFFIKFKWKKQQWKILLCCIERTLGKILKNRIRSYKLIDKNAKKILQQHNVGLYWVKKCEKYSCKEIKWNIYQML